MVKLKQFKNIKNNNIKIWLHRQQNTPLIVSTSLKIPPIEWQDWRTAWKRSLLI
jgi:hypothetical protein